MQSRDGRYLPSLSALEWLVFAGLAAALAVANIYTTLLTGWGEGGSIISVIAAVAMLRAFSRTASMQTLNLGQTMASAGASMGFSASAYAAVRMADPSFELGAPALFALFAGTAVLGVLIGASIRGSMIRYYFPSGTACAVILRTVTSGRRDGESPSRVLAIWGAIAAAATVPTKLALEKGGGAIIGALPLGSVRGAPMAIGLEPLLYGIGMIVGPRIGAGMLFGSLFAAFALPGLLDAGGVHGAAHSGWTLWIAISAVTVPTLAGLVFGRVFNEVPVVPSGFTPGAATHRVPATRAVVYACLGIAATIATAIAGHVGFGLPWYLTVTAIAIAVPLCLANGRVSADTDINPVLLTVILVMTAFALARFSTSAVVLLGAGIVGSTLATVAVDMMQDYRTGYLVDTNPTHQTSMQLIGVTVGIAVAIPFMLLLDARFGFGPNAGLPAPGPQIYTGIAQGLAGGESFTTGRWLVFAGVSAGASLYALFAAWPRTARYLPSLFGAGFGLLLPIEMTAPFFIGGLIKVAVTAVFERRAAGPERMEAVERAERTTMLIGAAIFAAAALVTAGLLVVLEILTALGIGGVYFAQ